MKSKLMPSVTVVIPAYNEESVIVQCLRALANQTVAPDEIIVVDNNSTDATAALAANFNVKLIFEPVQGIAAARNAGFDEASSDVIARIDADTIVSPDWVETIKRTFARHDSIVGISGPAAFYDHPFGRIADFIFNSWNLAGNRVISGSSILWGSNMALKRQAWLKVRSSVNNDNEVWEDIDLTMRVKPFGEIKYLRSLRVKTSARSSLVSAGELARYFARWPRTYAQFGLSYRLKSRLMYLSLSVVWLPAMLAKPMTVYVESSKQRQQRVQQRLRNWLGI